MSYKEWLKWRVEYFKENSRMTHKERPTEEQQMEAWEKTLKESDSGHRPC